MHSELGRDGQGQGVHVTGQVEETFGGRTSCVTTFSDHTAAGSSHHRGGC